MPPRTVKRGSAASGPKRTPRAVRGAVKVQNQPEVAEEPVKPEVDSAPAVEIKEDIEVVEVKVEEVVEEKSAVKVSEPESDPQPEPKSEEKSAATGSVSVRSKFSSFKLYMIYIHILIKI